MTTHTPGPWAIEAAEPADDSIGQPERLATIFTNIPNDDRFRYADIATVRVPVYGNDENGHPLTYGDAAANARLIAAAPQLLDALKNLVNTIDVSLGNWTLLAAVNDARDIIATAENSAERDTQ